MKKLNSFKLKLTALSPIHIGTGEVYEPTNFVISDGKLYNFNEVLFYKSLSDLDKKAFDLKLNNWLQIIDFYKSKTQEAIKLSNFSCQATKKVEESYARLKNKDGTKNTNQFQIAKTFKNPNTFRAIIPGSSIKGMLDTVLQIYPKKVKENTPRENLIVSDALLLDGGVEAGYSYRQHKNPTKEARSNIPQMVEIIQPNSSFLCHLKTEYSFETLQKMMQRYHNERKGDFFSNSSKTFTARIGKFCGKEYMVDDGFNVINSYGNPIATYTVYEKNSESFGWIKIELISDEEYENGLKEIKLQENHYFEEIQNRQAKTIQAIEKAKEHAKQIAEEKKQKELKEEQEEIAKQKAEKERLDKLSPFEVKLEEIIAAEPNKTMAYSLIILNNLKDGHFDEFKQEALEKIKTLMKKSGEWREEEPKPKPPKPYKDYKRTMEIKNMLKDL